MKTEQALAIIKQVLDAAVKGGIFPNMEASFQAAAAFNVIAEELKKENE